MDGESLEGATHQHAVNVIRRAFGDKAKDLMVFVVKVPASPTGPANTPHSVPYSQTGTKNNSGVRNS